MKYYKQIIRISVLLVIIILGFTAIFPEWLDLKDMVIADFQPRIKQGVEGKSSNIEQGVGRVMSWQGSILSSINQTILKEILPKPSGKKLFGPVSVLIWSVMALLLYVVFLALCIVVFFLCLFLVRKYLNTVMLSRRYAMSLYAAILIMSFGLSLVLWPYLAAVVL